MFEICRTCTVAIDPLEDPVPLNEPLQIEDDKLILSDVFRIFVSLNITNSDSLPKTVCKNCKFKATNAYSFWKMCKKSEEALLGPFQSNFVKVEPCEELPCEFDVPKPEDKEFDLIDNIKEESINEQLEVYPDPESEQSDIFVKKEPSEIKEEITDVLDSHNNSETEAEFLTIDITDKELNSLPDQSRSKYEKAYKKFMKWQEKTGTNSFSEDELLTYFGELKKSYKSTSLWVNYSMLRSTIHLKHDIDIGSYTKLRGFLKNTSVNYVPKKSKTLSSAEIKKFIKEAPDADFLHIKVAMIIGIAGGCRRNELVKLKMDHIEDLNSALLIKFPDSKTKVIRAFTITGDYYKLCKKYMLLRPRNCDENRFFLTYRRGQCLRLPVGQNTMGSLPKRIATFLKLPNPELYTGHCFKRSSAKLSNDNASRDLIIVKRHKAPML